MFCPSENLKFGKEEFFKEYYDEKRRVNKNLTLITSYKFDKIKIEEPRIFFKEIDASSLAEAVFLGYGLKDNKILYHNTYYE